MRNFLFLLVLIALRGNSFGQFPISDKGMAFNTNVIQADSISKDKRINLNASRFHITVVELYDICEGLAGSDKTCNLFAFDIENNLINYYHPFNQVYEGEYPYVKSCDCEKRSYVINNSQRLMHPNVLTNDSLNNIFVFNQSDSTIEMEVEFISLHECRFLESNLTEFSRYSSDLDARFDDNNHYKDFPVYKTGEDFYDDKYYAFDMDGDSYNELLRIQIIDDYKVHLEIYEFHESWHKVGLAKTLNIWDTRLSSTDSFSMNLIQFNNSNFPFIIIRIGSPASHYWCFDYFAMFLHQ